MEATLKRFPAQTRRTEVEWTCTGLPAHLIDEIGRAAVGAEWGQEVWVEESNRCECSLKTQ
eukprot:5721306-Lingulodinium_polyedra.AAC.1